MATQKEQTESLREVLELKTNEIKKLTYDNEDYKKQLKELKDTNEFYYDLSKRYLKIIENLTE